MNRTYLSFNSFEEEIYNLLGKQFRQLAKEQIEKQKQEFIAAFEKELKQQTSQIIVRVAWEALQRLSFKKTNKDGTVEIQFKINNPHLPKGG